MKHKNLVAYLGVGIVIIVLVFLTNYYVSKFVIEEQKFTNVVNQQDIKIFFGNENLNPNAIDCEKVFPVVRGVEQTPAIARTAVTELLKGPTQNEIQNRYYTSINNDVKINSLKIEDNVAYIDFDSTLQKNLGGSCRVASIREQITQTLLQFPTIKSVVISVEGNSKEVLQP